MLGVFAEFERSIIRAQGTRSGKAFGPAEDIPRARGLVTGFRSAETGSEARSLATPAERATAPQIELVPQGYGGGMSILS